MNIKRQEAMVKSVAKNMRQKEREQAQKDKLRSKLVAILNPTGKAIDEVTREDLSAKDFKFVQDYVVNVMNTRLMFYPNLQD